MTESYFKGRYGLSFYSQESGYDELVYFCENLYELAKHLKVDKLSSEFKSLKSRVNKAIGRKKLNGMPEKHIVIDGKVCKCYLIDMRKEVSKEILL